MVRRIFALTVLTALTCGLAGCGRGAAPAASDDEPTRGVMQVLGVEYGRYLADHRGTPPKDVDALRAYLQANMERLSSYGVKAVDELLKSPRDGKPFKIVVGKTIASPDAPDLPWAAYEQTGVDGMRMAANARGGVHEFGPEEFQKMLPAE